MSSLTKLNKVSDKMVRLSRNDKHLYKSAVKINKLIKELKGCLLYTSPSPRDS